MLCCSKGAWCCVLCHRSGSNLCTTSMVTLNITITNIETVLMCTVLSPVHSMDGFRVVKLDDVLPQLDVLITATGRYMTLIIHEMLRKARQGKAVQHNRKTK